MSNSLRVLIVTSQTTFVKDNYLKLIRTVTEANAMPECSSVCGVVFIKNAGFGLFIKSLYLFFNGAVHIATVLLKNLLSGYFLDKRKYILRSRKIPYFSIDDINGPESVAKIKELDPDLIINIRTRSIYKRVLLEIPKSGCINVHHGLLPEQRGTMCDLWAFYNHKPVGFTIHRMNEKIDDGEILIKKTVDIRNARKYIDIPQMSADLEAEAVLECIGLISEGVRIPEAVNPAVRIKYYRNPSRTTIKKMLRSGIKL